MPWVHSNCPLKQSALKCGPVSQGTQACEQERIFLFFCKSSPCVILGRVDSEINVLCTANLKTENNTLSLDMNK